MKKLFTLIIFLFISTITFAQPTIAEKKLVLQKAVNFADSVYCGSQSSLGKVIYLGEKEEIRKYLVLQTVPECDVGSGNGKDILTPVDVYYFNSTPLISVNIQDFPQGHIFENTALEDYRHISNVVPIGRYLYFTTYQHASNDAINFPTLEYIIQVDMTNMRVKSSEFTRRIQY